MISWTETTNFTALTSEYSFSSSSALVGSVFGTDVPLLEYKNVYKSGFASASLTRSANASGVTYQTEIYFNTLSLSADNVEGSNAYYSKTDNVTAHKTIQPNGASTHVRTSSFYSTLLADNLPEANESGETATTETFYAASTETTRVSETTTYASFGVNHSITTSSAQNATTGTISNSSATTTTTTVSATSTTLAASTISKTQVTTSSSTYTLYDGGYDFAGVGKRTNYSAENEVLWQLTNSGQTPTALEAIAASNTGSFVAAPLTTKTAKPVSTLTAFYSTEATSATVTSTVSFFSATTITLAAPGSLGLPLSTVSQETFTETTATTAVEQTGGSSSFGTSAQTGAVVALTMSGKSGGLTHQMDYVTTGTTWTWTDGITLPASTSSSGLVTADDGGGGLTASTSSGSSESATAEGALVAYGLAGVGGTTNKAAAIETVYSSAFALLSNLDEPFSSIGLSPQLTVLNSFAWSAFPRVAINQPTTASRSFAGQGSTTWSIAADGVSQTSIGTASDATAQTTSASWTGAGTPITRQFDAPPFFIQSPTSSFGLEARITRIGGKPAISDNISAYMPPGKYMTASGSVSGTTKYTEPREFAGTNQTAFAAIPEFFAMQGSGLTYSTPRNPFFYSSTFFPL